MEISHSNNIGATSAPGRNTIHLTIDKKGLLEGVPTPALPSSPFSGTAPQFNDQALIQCWLASALSSLVVRLFPGESVQIILKDNTTEYFTHSLAISEKASLNSAFTQLQNQRLATAEQDHCGTLTLAESGSAIQVELQCDPLFYSAQLNNWVSRHYLNYLERVFAQPHRAFADIELLSKTQSNRIFQQLNPHWQSPCTTHHSEPALIHQKFSQQVAATPLHVALECNGSSLSYQALDNLSNALSQQLLTTEHRSQTHTNGGGFLPPDTRVALIFERGPAWIISILAVLKAGAAYVPLDPNYPDSRLHYMLEDSGAQFVIGSGEMLNRLQASQLQEYCSQEPWQQNTQPTEAELSHHWLSGVRVQKVGSSNSDEQARLSSRLRSHSSLPQPQDLAYVIYTSGSTGKPKGVAIEHHSACALAEDLQTRFELKPGVRMLQFASPSFDASVFEWLGALCSGATLVVATKSELPPEKDMSDTLAEGNIHIAMLPPSLLRTMKPHPLPALRWLLSGGEPCSEEMVEKWSGNTRTSDHASASQDTSTQRQFINVYGPTEATVFTTASNHLLPGEPVSIGTPIRHRQVAIVNSWLELLPEGATGELCILGRGVARGYLNAAPAAQNFIAPGQIKGLPNDYLASPLTNKRAYRTGDLVRTNAQHTLDCIGRRDKQIKIRGFRVELGEIESALITHPQVQEAAVVLNKQDKTAFLVAFISLKLPHPTRPSQQHEQEIAAFLQQHLPAHMLPGRYCFIDELPLTPNGKIDRQALLNMAQTNTTPSHITPKKTDHHSNTEQHLLQIWREVLGQPNIQVTDNFYGIGGDSIIAIQVITALEAQGLILNASDVVSHPTIRQLAPLVQVKTPQKPSLGANANSKTTNNKPNKNSHQPTNYDRPASQQAFALSPIQQWLFEQNPAAIQGFCQYQTVRIRQLDTDKFVRALNTLLQYHDTFRQCFVTSQSASGNRIQRVYQESVPAVCLESLSQSASESALEAITKRTLQRWANEFSPETGQLVRAGYIALAEQPVSSSLVIIAIHHLVIDGVSWRLLLNQLHTLYFALDEDSAEHASYSASYSPPTSSNPPQVAIQAALTRYANQPRTFAQLEYWQRVLASGAKLSYINKASHLHPFQKAQFSTPLSQLTQSGNKNLALIPLLGAFAMGLQEITGENSVAFVTEGHGREHLTDVSFERCIGWFTSLFPVCFNLSHSTGKQNSEIGATNKPSQPQQWQSLYQQLKQQWLKVPDNGLSYGALRYLNADAKPGLTGQNATLPPVIFNFLGVFHRDNNPNWSAFDDQSGQDATQHALGHSALELNCALVNAQLQCHFSYDNKQLSYSVIERLHSTFLECVVRFAALEQAEQSQALPETHNTFGLTATQQGMLFHTLSNPELDNYLVQTLWDYPCAIHSHAMENAWRQASEKLAVFRTAYLWHQHAGEAQQKLENHSQYAFHWHDLSARTDEQQQTDIQRLIEADRLQPFDLSQPGAIRAHWLQLADNHCQLLLSHHHILMDGWSLALFLNAIDSLYMAQIHPHQQSKKVAEILPPSTDIQAFIHYCGQYDLAPAKRYFQQELTKGQLSTALPVNGTATSLNSLKTITHQSTQVQIINADTTARLMAAAQHSGVTLGALILLTAGLVQSANDNGNDTVFGTILSGRNHLPELASTPGMLASTLPVILRPNWQHSIAEAVHQMHVLLGELNRHSLLPLRDIQDEISGNPVRFSSIITFENYPGQDKNQNSRNKDKKNEEAQQFPAYISQQRILLREIEKTGYPLTLVFRPFQQQLECKISYDADVFAEADITRLQDQLSTALHTLAEHGSCLNRLTCNQLADAISRPIVSGQSTSNIPQPDTNKSPAAKASPELIHTLENVWKQVLDVSSVDNHDNYFALGGDSLNALQIMNALEQHGYQLSAADVLRFPEFQQMLDLLAKQPRSIPQANSHDPHQPANSNQLVQQFYPLAPTQLRFFSRNLANPHFFTIPVFSQLKQAVSNEQLIAAVDAALAVSDAHHVRFEQGNKRNPVAGIRQIPHRWQPSEYFRIVDLQNDLASDLPDCDTFPNQQAQQQATIQQAAEHASQSMNIWQGPLFRIVAFNNLRQSPSSDQPGKTLLFVVFHHLVSDGMSVNVFLNRLSAQLSLTTTEQASPQKRGITNLLPGNFLPWVSALHRYANVRDWRDARHEWQRIMARGTEPGTSVLVAPSHNKMSAFEMTLPDSPAQSDALRQQSQTLKTTPFTLLLTAFLLALQYIKRDNASLHIMGAQRNVPTGLRSQLAHMGDLNQCMGFFSAAVPFTGCIAQYLQTIQYYQSDSLLESVAQQHQHCSNLALDYLILQYLLPNNTGHSEAPAIPEQHEILFHYFAADPREQENDKLAPARFASGPASDPQNQSNYLLNTTLIHTNNQLRCRFYYSPNYIEEAELVRLHQAFTQFIGLPSTDQSTNPINKQRND